MHEADKPFWETKSLAAMSPEEWELLCDGCGRCCVNKLEDEDTEAVFFTSVACRLLDANSCRCSRYRDRAKLVSDCISLSPERTADFRYLPRSCAYRRLFEGRGLAVWHPLISGRADTVHEAGVSVRGRTISESVVHPDDLQGHIVDWFD